MSCFAALQHQNYKGRILHVLIIDPVKIINALKERKKGKVRYLDTPPP